MFIDQARIAQLRDECELHSVDYSRAKITPSGSGYTVRLPTPVVDLGETLAAPGTVEARNATYAEGEMLDWLLRITRAERQRVRVGRTYGMAPEAISRTPLSSTELADYKAEIAHAAKVKKLVIELAAATQAAAEKAIAAKGTADLAQRYGLATAKPTTVSADTAVPTGTSPQVKNRKQKVKS